MTFRIHVCCSSFSVHNKYVSILSRLCFFVVNFIHTVLFILALTLLHKWSGEDYLKKNTTNKHNTKQQHSNSRARSTITTTRIDKKWQWGNKKFYDIIVLLFRVFLFVVACLQRRSILFNVIIKAPNSDPKGLKSFVNLDMSLFFGPYVHVQDTSS